VSGVLMVWTNPQAGREDEFYDWYQNVHFPEVLAVPGFVGATRYVTAGTPGTHQHLAVYEVDGDVEAASADLFGRIGAGEFHMSDAGEPGRGPVQMWTAAAERVTPA
jgi:hypothetical protein